MFSLNTAHHYNNIAAVVFGYISTIILIYLVKTKTNKELKPYSQMLIQNCILDLLFNTNTLVFMAKIELRDGIMLIINDGLTVGAKEPWNFIFALTFVVIYLYCICSMSIPFFFRYWIFCRSITLNGKQIILLHLIPLFFILIIGILFYIAFYPTNESQEKHVYLVNNTFWLNSDGSIPNFISSDLTNIFFIIYLLFAAFLLTSMTILIVWCSRQIWKKFQASKGLANSKSLTLQKQLTIALIVQAACPLAIAVIPIMIGVVALAFSLDVLGLGLPLLMTLAWNSVANPWCTILIVGPFRKAIFRNLCMRKLLYRNNIVISSTGAGQMSHRNYENLNIVKPTIVEVKIFSLQSNKHKQ